MNQLLQSYRKNMFKLLQKIIILLVANSVSASSQPNDLKPIIDNKLQAIEREYHLKIGIYALDTNSGHVITYHANDRFPFQSTCKFIGVSALLASDKSLLEKQVSISPKELLFWHPISGQYVNQKVSLRTLAEGAISYSDNTAINIIIRELGGLGAINQFAHNIGNSSFKIAHYEVNLNSNPKINEDSSTPKDMALSIKKIMLEDVLNNQNKVLLLDWMRNNTTGYNRIRASVPLGWSVADKTGSGSYGIANDIGIVWSPACKPVILSIFTVSNQSDAKPSDAVIAQITKAAFEEFAPHHSCYKVTKFN
ncbi:TPA: class A beta-lactamase [Legionella pneumophila]|nr:class A beta-lactamase [Legionella pneumophila]HAT7913564.1 class A beta-lactamase [Legionella pneumophila]HAT7916567.1 class A beta-lactamase [Legionella pneumophila]HAT7983367.1 class A beta-lactamase [Legionella pneumophila]HAT7989841.1 class A beta-lactamase [Legionella pneumophila]